MNDCSLFIGENFCKGNGVFFISVLQKSVFDCFESQLETVFCFFDCSKEIFLNVIVICLKPFCFDFEIVILQFHFTSSFLPLSAQRKQPNKNSAQTEKGCSDPVCARLVLGGVCKACSQGLQKHHRNKFLEATNEKSESGKRGEAVAVAYPKSPKGFLYLILASNFPHLKQGRSPKTLVNSTFFKERM